MKIYDYTDYPYLNTDEKLIINMNSAVLTFHTEKDILTFRNTHLNWLLLYDLKLNNEDYMHARMAFNAYGDIVSVQNTISDESLNNLMTIADFCHGDLLMDLRHSCDQRKDLKRAFDVGVRYIIGPEYHGMTSCVYKKISNDLDEKEEII